MMSSLSIIPPFIGNSKSEETECDRLHAAIVHTLENFKMMVAFEPIPLSVEHCLALKTSLHSTRGSSSHKSAGIQGRQDLSSTYMKIIRRNEDDVSDEKKEEEGAQPIFKNRENSCSSLLKDNSPSSSETSVENAFSFSNEVSYYTRGSPETPKFDKKLRNLIEPYISQARIKREQARSRLFPNSQGTIASNTGVPYPSLRKERSFLFDVENYPLHIALAELLGVNDLSLLHEHDIQDINLLTRSMLDKRSRKRFHECYDSFVTKFCIPFLHSLAMTNDVFQNTSSSAKVNYRYQAFPCIHIVKPGNVPVEQPHCDIVDGHSIGGLNLHIPLTPAYGTNALFTESGPGREDWHPLNSKAIGLGYLFDGARCLHFGLENTTPHTRVSIDFRIAIHREAGGDLCSREILADRFSQACGFYDEAFIDSNFWSKQGAGSLVFKKHEGFLTREK